MSEKNKIQILDFLGSNSNNFNFNSLNKIILFNIGSFIVYFNLKNLTKTFIEFPQSEIALLKFIDESQHYMISIDKNSSPLLILWEIPSFRTVFNINIKTRPNFKIKKIYFEKIKNDKYLILITSIDLNIFYEFNISGNNFNIEYLANISNDNNNNAFNIIGFKTFFNSNDLCLLLNNSLQFYSILNKKCNLNHNVNFPFKLIKNSLRISKIVNLIAFLSEQGSILIFDQNGNNKPSLNPFNNEYFTTCEFSGDSIIVGTNNGKIYCYGIYEYKLKFYIDNNILFDFKFKYLLNNSDFINKNHNENFPGIERIFIDESVDTILIKTNQNSFLLSSISNIIKETRIQFNFISNGNLINYFNFSHFKKIKEIEFPEQFGTFYDNEIYTCSNDSMIIKYTLDINNNKINNEFFEINNNNNNNNNNFYISTIKFHPFFKNKLFAGDNKGFLYLFDVNTKTFQYKKYIMNYEISYLNFNVNGELICISFETGLNLLCNLTKNCEVLLKLNDHFLTSSEIAIHKNNNQILGFSYFFNKSETIDDIILYLKNQTQIEISKIFIENEDFNKEIISTLKIMSNIIDIVVHTSENYSICLTENKCIVINQLNNGEVTGIIDLNKRIKNCYNFSLDFSGLYLALICDINNNNINFDDDEINNKNTLIIFEIGTGNICNLITNCFSISKVKFDHFGKNLFIGSNKGDFSVWKIPENIEFAIQNVNNEIKINKNFWEFYEIKYAENNFNDDIYKNNNNNNINIENQSKKDLNEMIYLGKNGEILKDQTIQADKFNEYFNLKNNNENFYKNNINFNENLVLNENNFNNKEEDVKNVHVNENEGDINNIPNTDNNNNNNFSNSDSDNNNNNNDNSNKNNNNNKVENVFDNNLQNSYQQFMKNKNYKNPDPELKKEFMVKNKIITDNKSSSNISKNSNKNSSRHSNKNKPPILSKTHFKEDDNNFYQSNNNNKNVIKNNINNNKNNINFKSNLDPSLFPPFNNNNNINNLNNNQNKLNYISINNNNNNIQNLSYNQQNNTRIKNIANAINEMLIPESKEPESIDKMNSEIESMNNQEINYISKDKDENDIYFINNKRKNKNEENKKFPEPNDIDIDFSMSENNNNNNKKYPEPEDIDDVLSLNNENKNVISTSNYNNNIENEIIYSNSSNNNNIKFTNTNNNVNDNKNVTDEIDYFNDNIRDFEKRNNFK